MTLSEIAKKYFWSTIEIRKENLPKNMKIYHYKGTKHFEIIITDEYGITYQGIFQPTFDDLSYEKWVIITTTATKEQ